MFGSLKQRGGTIVVAAIVGAVAAGSPAVASEVVAFAKSAGNANTVNKIGASKTPRAGMLVALNSIPKVALAPLFVIWMGTGPEPKVAIAPIPFGDVAGFQLPPVAYVPFASTFHAAEVPATASAMLRLMMLPVSVNV